MKEQVPLSFRNFDTYYTYTVGDLGTVLFLPELPCAECGTKGALLVRCDCCDCGEPHSGMYCADSYAVRGKGTALTLAREVFRCRFCEVLGQLSAAMIPRGGMH